LDNLERAVVLDERPDDPGLGLVDHLPPVGLDYACGHAALLRFGHQFGYGFSHADEFRRLALHHLAQVSPNV
jgi:hypothetical protein